MGTEDRDWYREERRRRAKRRFRWPYRLRPGIPWWVREMLRQLPFWAIVAVGYLVYREFFR
jgi:hypothetical protein